MCDQIYQLHNQMLLLLMTSKVLLKEIPGKAHVENYSDTNKLYINPFCLGMSLAKKNKTKKKLSQ